MSYLLSWASHFPIIFLLFLHKMTWAGLVPFISLMFLYLSSGHEFRHGPKREHRRLCRLSQPRARTPSTDSSPRRERGRLREPKSNAEHERNFALSFSLIFSSHRRERERLCDRALCPSKTSYARPKLD
jgi:hypothetical protein